jgi:DNA-binding response OmpR family regulator
MADNSKRILIVEDNETLAQMYVSYLNINGFVTQTVGDGEKALSVALEFMPDLILLDIMMPKINGFDVLDILRNTPKMNNVPVIMLTALSEQEDKDRAAKLGVNDYLEKSETDLSTIVEKIRSHLKMDVPK